MARSLVGVRAPPLPHALSRPPTIFPSGPPRAPARARARANSSARRVASSSRRSAPRVVVRGTLLFPRGFPYVCLSSSNGASAVSVGKRDNKIW